MNKQDLSKVSVEKVGFSRQTVEQLKASNLLTMGAISFSSKEDLSKIYHLNNDSIKEIESKFSNFGSRLRTEGEKIMDNYYEDCMFGLEGPLWSKPKHKSPSNITREDIVNLYKERYFNEKGIKKYAIVDDQKIRQVVSNIKEEYLDFVYNIIRNNNIQSVPYSFFIF